MKLIINADDFGQTQAINEAIIELGLMGTVSSTTVMVNMPFANEAAKLLNISNFGIGLHLNLTYGRPLSQIEEVKSLVDDKGNFYPVKYLKHRLKKGLVMRQDILTEIKAQYQRLYQLIGNRLDHIDSHQDISKQEMVSQSLIEFTTTLDRRIGLRVYNKCYIHGNNENIKITNPNLLNIVRFGWKRSLTEMYFRNRSKNLKKHFEITDGMLLVKSQKVIDLLQYLPSTHSTDFTNKVFEVMCHPAVSIEGLKDTSLTNSRVDEYHTLKSLKFISFSEKVKLINFAQIS